VIVLRRVGRGAHALFHEGLDTGWSAGGLAEAADPLSVFCEQIAVGREVAGVEVAAVVEQEVLDLLLVLEALQARATLLSSAARADWAAAEVERASRQASTSSRIRSPRC